MCCDFFSDQLNLLSSHRVKKIRISSFNSPYFPSFRLNREIYSVNLHIQFECGKLRIIKAPNTYKFYGVSKKHMLLSIPRQVCFFFVASSEKPYYCKNSVSYVHALRCFLVFVKIWKFQILCKSCYYGNRNVKTQSHPEKRGDVNTAGNELV